MSFRKALWDKYKIKAIPIIIGDEIKILKGKLGKIVKVYRKRNCNYVDNVQREKQNIQKVLY